MIPLLAAGLISAGANIIGGLLGKSSANKAAEAQAAAADKAGKELVHTTEWVNPQIGEAASRAAGGVGTTVANEAGAVERAGGGASQMLDPYAGLGSEAVNALSMQLPGLTKTPTMADLEIDPGFAFRLAEGNKALERSAAARGGLLSGGQAKALAGYSQDLASQEYEKAYNRYTSNRDSTFQKLASLTGVGMSAADKQGADITDAAKWAGTARTSAAEYAGNADQNAVNAMASNTINAQRTAGDYATQGANAKAAGIIGGANSVNAGITNAGGSLMNALVLQSLLKK